MQEAAEKSTEQGVHGVGDLGLNSDCHLLICHLLYDPRKVLNVSSVKWE